MSIIFKQNIIIVYQKLVRFEVIPECFFNFTIYLPAVQWFLIIDELYRNNIRINAVPLPLETCSCRFEHSYRKTIVIVCYITE